MPRTTSPRPPGAGTIENFPAIPRRSTTSQKRSRKSLGMNSTSSRPSFVTGGLPWTSIVWQRYTWTSGQLSSNAEWLVAVIKKVNNPRCGTLPDFGNFPPGDYRYKAVKEMMPFAKGVSAKSYDFDDQGNETTIDYRRMMKIVLEAGYHGRVGIEYEGRRMSEEDGVRATKKLLERIREELGTDQKR